MAVSLNIDTDNDQLNQTQRFNIEGSIFILQTYFNSRRKIGADDRSGNWYLSLFDVDNNPILTGLRILPTRNMLKLSQSSSLFTGSIFCVDTEENTADLVINLDNFGQDKRFQLWYFTQDELAAASTSA